MTAIVGHAPSFPRWAIPAAVAFAVLTPAAQAIFDLGLSAAEFASDGDETLQAAGYAFGIWGVIYLALIVYALFQARRRESAMMERMAPFALLSITGCGLWIIVSAADLRWATVAVILASAAAAVLAVVRGARAGPYRSERLLALWPMALLAGWLTIASAVNVLTVLTSEGLLRNLDARAAAAVAGVSGATLIALGVTWRTGQAPYAAAVCWGLTAVYVAERDHQPNLALAALVGAALVAAAALYRSVRPPQAAVSAKAPSRHSR